MKASPSQLFKEAEVLKASLTGESIFTNDAWQKRQELCHLFESLLLIDLDYALDRKVEQDLWSFIFRNPISACQSKAKEHKKSNNNFTNSQLTTLLETAGGFYFQLLQKLCCAYDMDLPSHPRDSVYGLTKDWISQYPVAHQPRKSSLLYICQHCLVHMGDIARYRGQSLQAENFYRHAVELVPSNGQPYNQLALLEAASGEKLSTAFFHVRSLCVQHPFPVAATNLQNLFAKMPSEITISEGKARISSFEYVTAFLQFHAIIHLNNDLKKAEIILIKLTTYLPALIITEKFETWQLVQMVSLCLFAIEHAWGTADMDKNSAHLDEAMLSAEELKCAALIEELLGSMLHAFLFPVHSFPEPKETASYYTLPAIKVILDWLMQDPQLLQHETITKNPQVWHCLCILLNHLDVITKESYEVSKYQDRPLPEDWDLQAFLPLKKSQRNIKFNLNAATPSDEVATWLRAIRLCKLGEQLAGLEGVNLLSLTQSDGKRVFKAVHQTVSLSVDVLQQIQELAVNAGSPTSSDSPAHLNGNCAAPEISSLRSKSSHTEGPPQQEVRFKLDESQERKEKSENERESERRNKENLLGRGEKRSTRQNVAMQAILQQQRASQMSMPGRGRCLDNAKDSNTNMLQESSNKQNSRLQNHLDNSHMSVSQNCQSPQIIKEVDVNRPVHTLSPEQYNQYQQQTHSMNGVPKEAWIQQQYNMQQSNMPVNQIQREGNFVPNMIQPTRVVRPTVPQNFQPTFPPQQQQPPPQMVTKQMGLIAANPPPPPNVLWAAANYMGPFVAQYQQNNHQQVLVQQPTTQPPQRHPQQTPQPPNGYFLINGGTPQQMELDTNQLLQAAYRNQGAAGMQQDVMQQSHQQMQEAQRMWHQQQQESSRAEMMNQQVVGGRPVSQPTQQMQGSGPSVSSHDLCSNTYSLFNSPWSSGIAAIPRQQPKENQHNMDTVFMQSRSQSLWSGPGPSPLERLLEQQKQRRDGAT